MNIEEGIRRIGHVVGGCYVLCAVLKILVHLGEILEDFSKMSQEERVMFAIAISVVLLMGYFVPVIAARVVNWVIRGFRTQPT